MATKQKILREPTTSEDLDAKYGRPLLEVLKAALTVGGGVAGVESGPIGAIGGATLGSMAGQSLENIYKTMLFGPGAVPSATHGLPRAALEGATAEMGGRILGKGIEKALANTLKETLPPRKLEDYLETSYPGALREEYHGSDKIIEEVLPGRNKTGFKGDVFYSTEHPEIAEAMGIRKLATKPEFHQAWEEGGRLPRVPITKLYMARVKEMDINNPVEEDVARELGRLFKVEPKNIEFAINQAKLTQKGIDADTLWDSLQAMKYMDDPKFVNSDIPGNALDAVGAEMIENLKEQGIRRLRIPMDPMHNVKESIHFFPEDVYPSTGPKLKALRESLANQPIRTKPAEVSEELVNLLGRSIAQGEKLSKEKAAALTQGRED